MPIDFRYKKEQSTIFGDVFRPRAEVILKSRDCEIRASMYVDSGADITLIPRILGETLGFELGEGETKELSFAEYRNFSMVLLYTLFFYVVKGHHILVFFPDLRCRPFHLSIIDISQNTSDSIIVNQNP